MTDTIHRYSHRTPKYVLHSCIHCPCPQILSVIHAQGQVMLHLPLNNEAFMTVVEVIWFKDTSSFGHKQIHLFKSLAADKHSKESKEPELPKPMIAVAATAVGNYNSVTLIYTHPIHRSI